jgi:hypothetical protein
MAAAAVRDIARDLSEGVPTTDMLSAPACNSYMADAYWSVSKAREATARRRSHRTFSSLAPASEGNHL